LGCCQWVIPGLDRQTLSRREYHYQFLYIWLYLVPFHSFRRDLRRELFAHEPRIHRRQNRSVGNGLEIVDYFELAPPERAFTLVDCLIASLAKFLGVHAFRELNRYLGNSERPGNSICRCPRQILNVRRPNKAVKKHEIPAIICSFTAAVEIAENFCVGLVRSITAPLFPRRSVDEIF